MLSYFYHYKLGCSHTLLSSVICAEKLNFGLFHYCVDITGGFHRLLQQGCLEQLPQCGYGWWACLMNVHDCIIHIRFPSLNAGFIHLCCLTKHSPPSSLLLFWGQHTDNWKRKVTWIWRTPVRDVQKPIIFSQHLNWERVGKDDGVSEEQRDWNSSHGADVILVPAHIFSLQRPRDTPCFIASCVFLPFAIYLVDWLLLKLWPPRVKVFDVHMTNASFMALWAVLGGTFWTQNGENWPAWLNVTPRLSLP